MFGWIPFLTYAFITAGTPGPNNVMSMSNGKRYGFRGALPFNLGIWCGFSTVMVLCAVFCSLLSECIPKIQMPMLAIGALYILYLAWETFRASPEMEEHKANAGFASGLFLQFVNPKIFIYGIVSMEAYILPHYAGQVPAVFAFAMLLAFIGFAFTLLWSAFGSVFRRLFSRHGKTVNTLMALALVYCAVSLFL